MKRTAIYVRTSSHNPKDEASVTDQEMRVKDYCLNNEWFNMEVYCDIGKTGANNNRPDLDRLKLDVMDGKVERIVVFRYDRLTRDVLNGEKLIAQFRTFQIPVISIDGINTEDETHNETFVRQIRTASYELFRKEFVIRGNDGKERKLKSLIEKYKNTGLSIKEVYDRYKEGKSIEYDCVYICYLQDTLVKYHLPISLLARKSHGGFILPYGWKPSENEHGFEPDVNEQRVIQSIRKLRVLYAVPKNKYDKTPGSWGWITNYLNGRNGGTYVPTRKAIQLNNKSYSWSHNMVKKIAEREVIK